MCAIKIRRLFKVLYAWVLSIYHLLESIDREKEYNAEECESQSATEY